MSVLFKLLNVVVIIQKVMSTSYVQQYTTPGTYAVMIPADSAGVTLSMWGAGGAGTGLQNIPSSDAVMYPGGSGAFVSCTINALPGSTIYLLVGGGGAAGNYGQNSNTAIGGGGQGTVPNGANSWSPAGGGGRSAIQFSSGVDAIVAGGGGGGGASNTQYWYHGGSLGGGGGGGLAGLDGGGGSKSGGGGTTSSGGEGGISTEHFVIDGTAGTLGIGGNGGRYSSGGYYGRGGSGVDFGVLGAGGGGSSYIGGCNATYPITYLSGVTGTTTMPGGSTRSDYIPGVGVGNVGTYASLQLSGGNGAIVLTFTSPSAAPSSSPSAAPSSSPSADPSTSTSKIINIITLIAIIIGSILFSGTIIFYCFYFFSVLRSNDATMDFDDNRHNDTRIHQEYNDISPTEEYYDISPTCPDEEVYPTSVIELPIAKAVPTDDESENLPVAYIF